MEIILGSHARQAAFTVSELTEVAAVRRAAGDLAARLHFSVTGVGQIALVVTEAATNILKHAGRGEILLRPLAAGGRAGIEILVIDAGPGMPNLLSSMVDGNSTAGSYGGGLGAMRRLAAQFDVFSAPGLGTVIGMVLWDGDAVAPPGSSLEHGVVCLPMRGETVCGDAWGLHCDSASATVVVADGLGHGPEAAVASEAAVATAMVQRAAPVATVLGEVHAALRATRGAALAVLQLDLRNNVLQFGGVGNIAAHVYDAEGSARQMVSHNGIVGSNMRKVQVFPAPWAGGALLVVHSDGLGSRWSLDHYPGLFTCPARVIAALLYRDFARGRDDVIVLVVREEGGGRR